MDERNNHERRKAQFVDRRQQIRFAIVLVFYALLYHIIFLFLTMVPPFSTVLTDPAKVEPLLRRFVGFHLSHWWIGLITLGLIGGLSIIFSHQIFGPVTRCKRMLSRRLEGLSQPEKLHLRKGDYFQELATLIEKALGESPSEEMGPVRSQPSRPAGH